MRSMTSLANHLLENEKHFTHTKSSYRPALLVLTLIGLRGGGAKCPPEGFAKYLKNGLANLHQTL